MNWEYDTKKSKCPCGHGEIHYISGSDDWNRYSSDYQLHCAECAKKYHVESYGVQHKWEYYQVFCLVPNGLHIDERVQFDDSTFEKWLAGRYSFEDIVAISEEADNITNSKLFNGEIVKAYKRYHNSQNMKDMRVAIKSAIANINSFEHTKSIRERLTSECNARNALAREQSIRLEALHYE